MKIENDFSQNFFKCFNEAQGVATAKRIILKSKNINVTTYLENLFLISILLLLFGVLFLTINNKIIFCLFIFADLLNIFLHTIYISERVINKNNLKGNTIINEKGIINDSYKDIEMHFSWDLVQAVVIKKYSITILTKTPCFFFFDISKEKEIRKLLKKYKKENLIIEES